jgi:hypothetical protein
MKKQAKKLVLAKETVRQLTDRELAVGRGGSGLLTVDPQYSCVQLFTSGTEC